MTTEAKSLVSPDMRELQIHIHEHVTPLRERVSRVEGIIEGHSRELAEVRVAINALKEKVDENRYEILSAIAARHVGILERFQEHESMEFQKHDALDSSIRDAKTEMTNLRNWVIGIGVGIGSVFALFEFITRIHVGG